MAKKKVDMAYLKIKFNDFVMRELGLDITEDDYLYDMDTQCILQIKEKFIKYCEDDYPILRHNEIELNLLENPRLTETLVIPYISKYCDRNNIVFQSISQSPISGSKKGCFVLSYISDGEIKEIKSDAFVNESLRIFNLICKLNKTSHMYDFNEFDIEIIRKKR